MSDSVTGHRAGALRSLNLAVVTVSDTRTIETDTSGRLLVELAESAGHHVAAREIIRDEPDDLRGLIRQYADRDDLHAVLITGGTGISPRDRTPEAVSAILTKPIPGFGELFRMLSHAEIGSACILSRALGGLVDRLVVLALPGSRAAVELGMTRIILPELPHLVAEARKV